MPVFRCPSSLSVLLLAIWIGLPVVANAASRDQPITVLAPLELPAGFQYPNGIAVATDGSLYVGSVTSGKILRVDPDGRINTFFDGHEAVFGGTSLRIDEPRRLLWGTSPDYQGLRQADGMIVRRPHRVFAIHMDTAKLHRTVLVPDNGFGNDLAVDAQGGVYLTDSTYDRVLYLAPDAERFTVLIQDERLGSDGQGLDGVGPAGIAITKNGQRLAIGTYGNSRLFLIALNNMQRGEPVLTEVELERPLDNPDGLQFLADGSLLVTEGAAANGNGKLSLLPGLLQEKTDAQPVQVLVDGLDLPVNLTVKDQAPTEVWVTESGIRHLLVPDGNRNAVPEQFFIHHYRLPG